MISSERYFIWGFSVENNQKVNVNSLILIREELVATIEQAANHLEAFLSDTSNSKSLESCVDLLRQIRGSLALIQLYGAQDLAAEILQGISDIAADDKIKSDDKLSELSRSFFILSHYFEYALQRQRGMPVLLIPYINSIRVSFHKPLLQESHYSQIDTSYSHHNDAATEGDLEDLVRRLRHMYQVGLLGLLRQTGVAPSLKLMQRSLSRLCKAINGDNTLFWVAHAAMIAFEEDQFELTLTRKRALSSLDRQFKQLTQSTSVNDDLLKEFLYWLSISRSEDRNIKEVKSAFALEDSSYSEADLQREQHSLTGPTANTVSSVVSTIQDELRDVKEIMENASMGDHSSLQKYGEMITKMTNIKDILDVVGLKSASQTMKQQLDKLKELQEKSETADSVELLEIADAFLYIESTLKGLNKLDFSSDRIVEINKITRREMIIASNLAEAKKVVLDEVEAGLAMVKRALSAFNDSEYDRAHIRNVPPTLNSIRGGMLVLEKPRAAAIVASSCLFIEGSLLPATQPAALEQMLDTFADALIGLEYYLDCVKIDNNVDDEILAIAEESLAALGYGVSHS